MNTAHPARAAILLVALILVACSGGAASTPASGPPATGSPATSAQATSAPPTGSETVDPETPTGTNVAPAVELPPPGSGELVVPKPGQLDVREIPADLLEAQVDGRSVTLRITFTSGVEPCYVLDSIVVTRGDHAFAVTLRQGHGPGDLICIDLAVTRYALVNLGDLEPGTYTITDAAGGAAPIGVVVS
jgi:hypothetical protein